MKRPTRRRPLRARLGRALLLVALLTGALGFDAEPVHAADTIETEYERAGSFAPVTEVDVADPAAPGETFAIFRPATLGGPSGTYDHPILVWGNGTGGEDSGAAYAPILGHLASWGYVVIAPNDGWVGNGVRLRAAASYMVSQNSDPSSPFHQKLDVTRIGAIGHSQGAGGATIATMEAPSGLIDSTVAIALPDPYWWCRTIPFLPPPPPDAPPCRPMGDPTRFLTRFPAPLFLVRGADDDIAEDHAPCNDDGLPGMDRGCYTEWVSQVPGMAVRTSHADFIGAIDHLITYEMRGYITAWFDYTLLGKARARSVFAGSAPELFDNDEWLQLFTEVKNPR